MAKWMVALAAGITALVGMIVAGLHFSRKH